MNIFPTRLYTFKLPGDQAATWDDLKKNTQTAHTLVSFKTDRKFIGIVEPGHFRLISPVGGKGAFCTVEGNMVNEDTGTLEVEVHKSFRILIWAWLVFVLCGTLVFLILKGPWVFVKACVAFGAIILMARFLFLKVLFNSVADNTINDIAEVMHIEPEEQP